MLEADNKVSDESGGQQSEIGHGKPSNLMLAVDDEVDKAESGE